MGRTACLHVYVVCIRFVPCRSKGLTHIAHSFPAFLWHHNCLIADFLFYSNIPITKLTLTSAALSLEHFIKSKCETPKRLQDYCQPFWSHVCLVQVTGTQSAAVFSTSQQPSKRGDGKKTRSFVSSFCSASFCLTEPPCSTKNHWRSVWQELLQSGNEESGQVFVLLVVRGTSRNNKWQKLHFNLKVVFPSCFQPPIFMSALQYVTEKAKKMDKIC